MRLSHSQYWRCRITVQTSSPRPPPAREGGNAIPLIELTPSPLGGGGLGRGGERIRCRGVTLIETLIAMVIVSVGLLAIAALQIKSVQFAHASYQRTVASIQASDLIERLWAGFCKLPDEAESIAEDWEDMHSDSLPGWRREPSTLAPNGEGVYSFTIHWQERVDGVEHSFTYQALLPVIPGCP